MATRDELSEGIINKPKNTALHNRLEQKNAYEKKKAQPNLRYASPQVQLYQFGQDTKNKVIYKDTKNEKIERHTHEHIITKVESRTIGHDKPTANQIKLQSPIIKKLASTPAPDKFGTPSHIIKASNETI